MARVAIVSHSFLEQDPRVRRSVDAFLHDGWAVDGLFLDPPVRTDRLRTWQVPIERKRGGPLRYLFEYGAFFMAISWWLIRRLLSVRPDLVYINSPPDAFSLAAWPARLRKIPIILDVHDPMPELLAAKRNSGSALRRLLELQERWGMRFADGVITVHEPLRDLFQGRLGELPMTIVMNVPDASELTPVDWNPDSRTVVFTGTIASRYGVLELVEAVGLARNSIPGLRLRLIGEGEDLPAVHDKVKSLDLGDVVEFVGRIPWEQVRAAQEDAWVGVNAPRPDELGSLSFSNKIVEWVTLGLPVIAAESPTLLRYFPPGTLRYVDGGSAQALTDALIELDRADPGEVRRQIAASLTAMQAIAWPVQRDRLLATARRLIGQ